MSVRKFVSVASISLLMSFTSSGIAPSIALGADDKQKAAAVTEQDGKELYKFKTPSGIIGNINTFEHKGKQYIAVLSGVGGWAGIGLAGGLLSPDNAAKWHGAVDQGRAQGDEAQVVGTAGLGAVGGYAALADFTTLGGQLTVFGLPN